MAIDKKPAVKKLTKAEKENIKLKEEIELLKFNASKVINEYKENSKRVKEQYELDRKYRAKSLLEDLVKHIDIFESALFSKKEVNAEFKNWLIGFEMVYSGLINSLTNEGMKVIDIKVGDKLNTKYHMAIDLIEDDTKEENTILEIKQKGYVLHDRLIRPTTVVVSKKKETKKKDKKESK